MWNDIIEKIRRYQELPDRQDLEQETSDNVAKGYKLTGMNAETPEWMISMISFLKWYYVTTSAMEANARAEKEGIIDTIAVIFKKECTRR